MLPWMILMFFFVQITGLVEYKLDHLQEYFESRFREQLTLYQHSSYSEMMASLWLSLRLQVCYLFSLYFVFC